MTWNYRIVRRLDGSYAIHEIYYDKDGKPVSMTENPATFGCDNDRDPIEEVLGSLRLAIGIIEKEPILDEAEAFRR